MITKLMKTALLFALFIFTSLALAEPSLSNLRLVRNPSAKTSSQSLSDASKKSAKGDYYYPTDIEIVNDIPDPVFLSVPGSNDYDEIIYPYETIHLVDYDYNFRYINVILEDMHHISFFTGALRNHTTYYTSYDYYSFKKRSAAAKEAHK